MDIIKKATNKAALLLTDLIAINDNELECQPTMHVPLSYMDLVSTVHLW